MEGLVTAQDVDGGVFFVWSKEANQLSIRLDYRYCPEKLMVGKWIKFKIDQNSRVCETVSIISEVFPTRVMKAIAEINIDLKYVGDHNGQFATYSNSYVGKVIDPRGMISYNQKESWYTAWIIAHRSNGTDARWRISSMQEVVQPNKSIAQRNIPATSGSSYNVRESQSVIGSLNNSERLTIVEGIVYSYYKQNDYYQAWSKAFPRSTICLDPVYCPPGTEMMGKWIEMRINIDNRVKKEVVILKDLYDTRVQNGFTEIRIEMEYVGVLSQLEMYFHEYFGNVCDIDQIVENPQKGSHYFGYIVNCKLNGVPARWRLARYQTVEGPLRNAERAPASEHSRRRWSPSRFSRPDERRPSSPEYYHYEDQRNYIGHDNSRRFSPDRGSRNRSRSPVRHNYAMNTQRDSRHLSPIRATNEIRGSPPFDRSNLRRSLRFPEESSRRGFDEGRPFRRSPIRNTHSQQNQRADNRVRDGNDAESMLPSSTMNMSLYGNRTMDSSENNSRAEENSAKEGKSQTARERLENLIRQREDEVREGEKQILDLTMKLERVGEIVAFFNSNKEINHQLRQMDIEQYDELLELTQIDE